MDEAKTKQLIDAANELGKNETVKEFLSIILQLQKDGAAGMSTDFLRRYLEALKDFDNIFVKAVSDPEHFMSLSDIESMIMGLQAKQRVLARELAWEKAKDIDETPLIDKKKRELDEKGVRLRKWRKLPKTVMTMFGRFLIQRTALIPSTPDDESRLFDLTGKKIIFPLDEALGLDRLPFKVSVAAMLEIAYWVQEIPSYDAATRYIRRNTQIDVKEDTVRAVANHIASMIFEAETVRTEKKWAEFQSGKLQFPKKKRDHDLYIEVDGAMVHTRLKTEEASSKAVDQNNERKSVWMENKLGIVFNSNDFIWWTDNHGERQHMIGKREYIAYLGPAEVFQKYLFAAAIRNNYGHYKQTILISDGATWIRNMTDLLFPDAQQILDLFHLCENVNKYAKSIFNGNKEIYKPWVNDACDLMKASKHKEVLGMIGSIDHKLLSRSSFNLARYIENNEKNIDYATYKKRGWYVGSGAIESGNKTDLLFRLKQPGMRWSQDCGQYIVSLMARSKSGLWKRDVEELIRSKYEVDGVGVALGRREI